jgi:hypothetical protein
MRDNDVNDVNDVLREVAGFPFSQSALQLWSFQYVEHEIESN